MAVDQLIPARRFKQRHHHDRHLLPLLGQGAEKTALTLRPPEPQVRVPLVELMKFQIHGEIPAPDTQAVEARQASLTHHVLDHAYA